MDRSRPRRCTGWSRIDCGSMRRMYASLAIPRTPQLSLPMRGSAGQRTPRSDVSDFEGGQRAEMNSELAVVLVLLAAAIAMFAINRPRMDAVALIMLTVLPFTGVITMGEALAGFSDANIILIAALFVIGDGLVRTGVARSLGDWLTVRAGSSEVRLIALLMIVVCGLGSMMSSTAVTAIFIPVAL